MIRQLLAPVKRAAKVTGYALAAPGWWLFCGLHGVAWRWGWRLSGRPLLRARGGRIIVGERFTAHSVSDGNAIGVSQPVILSAWGPGSELRIGDDVGMSGCSITATRRVVIGNRVLIGAGVLILDSDAHPLEAEARRRGDAPAAGEIHIGDDVFIGARAIILKNVHLGAGAVIGAGAVVLRDVPAGMIAAGNPARVVGRVRPAAAIPQAGHGEGG